MIDAVGSYIGEACSWVWNNKQWLFDGAGVVLIVSIAAWLRSRLVRPLSDRPANPPPERQTDPPLEPKSVVSAQPPYRVQHFKDGTDLVEGTLFVGTVTWHSLVKLPAFKHPPTILLFPKSQTRARHEPQVRKGSITSDSFIVDITRNDQQGEWEWRAQGTLRG